MPISHSWALESAPLAVSAGSLRCSHGMRQRAFQNRVGWRKLRHATYVQAGGPRKGKETNNAETPVELMPGPASIASTEEASVKSSMQWAEPDGVLDVDLNATSEMGVEDLYSFETSATEVLEQEMLHESEVGASLQEAFQSTLEEVSKSQEENSEAVTSSTQTTELGLYFPKSNVQMPTYSGAELEAGIVHFGVGGFFRAHQLAYMDYLLRHNLPQNQKWGYIGIGVLPQDKFMRDALREQENMYTVIAHSAQAVSTSGHSDEDLVSDNELKENVRVVAALKDMLLAPEEPGEVLRTLSSEGVKIYSLTITEFGYTVPTSKADIELLRAAKNAAKEPWQEMDGNAKLYAGATAVGMIVAGLQARRSFGSGGATILSCDNIPGNGDYVKEKVLQRAESAGGGLKEWIQFNCTFPNCMVDRITPITSETVKHQLAEKHGIKDNWPVACETFSQWVIEDNFAEGLSGRPRWEEVGVQMVQDVKPYELAKIRMLNVTHSVMVFPALLMGLEYIFEAAIHPLTKDYYTYVMQYEMRPTLEGIEGIDNINLDVYQDILVERFSNTLVADTLMRVAQDTSNKFSVQGCPAVREGLALGVSMKGMAFMVACWGHFIQKCVRAGIEFKDPQVVALKAAMDGGDINLLLDMEPVFHDLMFEDEWRKMVVEYYDMIKFTGIRASLRAFSAVNM
mmetsp:Transcript_27249/g.68608  ORF Transcript_27249/g.68608 Transcript_27249/m.68608 type:complete len:683 (+) Transcript_27249:203-2251(+)